jgi:hypothetical protein
MIEVWTKEETRRLNMNLAFGDYADAGAGELLKLRGLLNYLLTEMEPDETYAILRWFLQIVNDPKAWADWRDEVHEIARISAACAGDGEIIFERT